MSLLEQIENALKLNSVPVISDESCFGKDEIKKLFEQRGVVVPCGFLHPTEKYSGKDIKDYFVQVLHQSLIGVVHNKEADENEYLVAPVEEQTIEEMSQMIKDIVYVNIPSIKVQSEYEIRKSNDGFPHAGIEYSEDFIRVQIKAYTKPDALKALGFYEDTEQSRSS